MNKFWLDRFLLKIISVFIVLNLSISVLVLPSRAETISIPSQEIEVTTDSTPTEVIDDTISIPSQEIEVRADSTPTKEIDDTISIPSQEIEVRADSTPTKEIELPEEIVSTPVEIDTPDILIAPEKSEPLTIETVLEPILTPEQTLLSALQAKVSEITSQYGDELIVSGEADLLTSHLLLKVNDDWYKLNESRQDRFVDETFKRSQKFNFNQLEIKDLQDNLIARSPIVGNQMIILQRTN